MLAPRLITPPTELEKSAVPLPDLKQHLFTPDSKLRSFVNVYLNDEDVRYLEGKQTTAVKETDELTIIPSIAGGMSPAG